MAEWTQEGFAVIADSNMDSPMVVSFRPSRAMAEVDLRRNQLIPAAEFAGTVMEKILSSMRIVPARLTFDDERPEPEDRA